MQQRFVFLRRSVSRQLFVFGCALISVADAAEEITSAEPLPVSELVASSLPTATDQFVGPAACAECHEEEYLVWSRTNHATNAYDLLRTSSNAKRYAANLNLDANQVTSNPRCLACHSTPQSETDMHIGLTLGVTCESCHHAAGGEDGWLNVHSTYGLNGIRREEETAEHRRQRISQSRFAGQLRCDDLYSLAKQCYECHVIGDEELVVRGGHNPGNSGFEMTSWFNLDMRHNLFLDPRHNGLAPSLWADPLWRPGGRVGQAVNRRRLMYVVALLVDLEVSLRNRGRASHALFASSAATRIAAASSRLKHIAEGKSAGELEQALDAVARLESNLFAPPVPRDSKSFLEAARLISGIAKKISSDDRGDRFSNADRFLGPLPQQPHRDAD